MAGSIRRRAAMRAVVVVALAVVVDPIGVVQAQNIPSSREVQDRAAAAVSDAQARLEALAAELDEARVGAAKAVEAYNGARVELARARRAEQAAVDEATLMRDGQATADAELGRLAAAAYRSGGGFSDLGVVVNIVTDESIVDISEALAAVTRSRSAVRARWTAALDTAESAVRDAGRQVAERAEAEHAAEQALDRAKRAVAEHEDAVTRAEAQHDALMAELAAARGTTAELERERRHSAEQREQAERERAEREGAEREHAEGRRAEQEREDTEPSLRERAGHKQADSDEQADSDGRADSDPQADAEPQSQAAPAPATSAEPAGRSFAGAANAQRAIDYARAQLGKPYVWAGAGPAGFDCSGLTMRAWEHGGVQLTHWSVAQARQTVAVSYADLRPGDLIFWSTNDAPSGTYHVALYIGGGEMIHAPSPGGHVEIRDVFYWRTPSFYARVA